MDIPTLERAVTTLEKSLDSWEMWLAIATSLVVAGLILEYWPEVRDWIKERPFKWKTFRKLAGALLVTIGVAGELLVQFGASRTETKLRSANHDIQALLDREAAEARRVASEADAARIKLQATMMLRRLSKSQADALCAVIPKNLLIRTSVVSSSQDWEAYRYGTDFNEALRACAVSAKVDVPHGMGNSFWSHNVTFGVWVRTIKHLTLDNPKSKDVILNPVKRRALAESVRKALVSSGVKVEGVSDEGGDLIDIYIGPRFPPTDETLNTDNTKNP